MMPWRHTKAANKLLREATQVEGSPSWDRPEAIKLRRAARDHYGQASKGWMTISVVSGVIAIISAIVSLIFRTAP